MVNSKRKIEGKLFKITWPIFIELLLFMLLGSMDIFMLGRYSDNAVAAVGVVNQVMGMVGLLFGVITTGTMVILAQYLGAKKSDEDILRLSGTSLGINFILGLTLSAGMVVFNTVILKMMNIAPELMTYSSEYIKIVGGFTFVQAIAMTFTALIRTHGFTKICMFVTLGMNIFNVISNYTLIFGNFGAPQLGVSGAAISTVLSKSLGTLVLGIFLYKKIMKNFSLKLFRKFPMDELKKIVKIGAPSAGEQISYSLARVVGTIILTYISVVAIAANNYVNNIVMFIYLFSVAMGQGTAILIGRLVGEGKNDHAYKLCMSSFKKSLLVSVIMATLVAVFGKYILGIFTTNAEIIALASAVLFVDLILEPGRVFNIVIINSLRAAGDVKFPVYVGIVSMWSIGVGVAYILSIHLGLGLFGMWIALALDEWVRGIIMYRRWKSRKWEGKSLAVNNNEMKDVVNS